MDVVAIDVIMASRHKTSFFMQ